MAPTGVDLSQPGQPRCTGRGWRRRGGGAARQQLGVSCLGVGAEQVVFTSAPPKRTTWPQGLGEARWRPGATWLPWASDTGPCFESAALPGGTAFSLTVLPVGADGLVTWSSWRRLRPDTVLVKRGWRQTRSGCLSALASTPRCVLCGGTIAFHCDGARPSARFPCSRPELASICSASAHKIYGPKGDRPPGDRSSLNLAPTAWRRPEGACAAAPARSLIVGLAGGRGAGYGRPREPPGAAGGLRDRLLAGLLALAGLRPTAAWRRAWPQPQPQLFDGVEATACTAAAAAAGGERGSACSSGTLTLPGRPGSLAGRRRRIDSLWPGAQPTAEEDRFGRRPRDRERGNLRHNR